MNHLIWRPTLCASALLCTGEDERSVSTSTNRVLYYSDRVSVPVALGNYEDKIELLQKIVTSERIEGTAVALRGLDAAREQFALHSRRGVPRILLLITHGNYR